jgi:hypothetical protein
VAGWRPTVGCNVSCDSSCVDGVTMPNARADLPRIKDANRESGCEGDNRG